MTILERIETYRKVWRIVLPHLAEPSPEDVARWAVYPIDAVEAAILRTGRRFARSKISIQFDPQQAYRYVTATARNNYRTKQHTNNSSIRRGDQPMKGETLYDSQRFNRISRKHRP